MKEIKLIMNLEEIQGRQKMREIKGDASLFNRELGVL